MRNWAGLLLFAAAAWLIYAGLTRRGRVIADWKRNGVVTAEPAGGLPLNSLVVFGEIMRPIILFVLVVLGIKLTVIYFWIDGGQTFSYFDLAGLLVLLASYGLWVNWKVTYSPLRHPAVPASVAPSAEPEPVLAVAGETAEAGAAD